MKYREYTIITNTDAEDLIADMLNEIPVNGVEIIDNTPISKEDKAKMFIDIEPVLPDDDGSASVRFYLDMEDDEAAVLEKVKAGIEELRDFMDVGTGEIIKGETDEEDWINNWKKYFKSFYLDDILMKPSWEEVPEGANYKVMVEIDPKTSFGTGHHETTQLCIRGLRKYMEEGNRVLDLGTGSGILSIIALKLGASYAYGTDIDPICAEAIDENMERNHIDRSTYDYVIGDLITDSAIQDKVGVEKYDICLANILSDVIIPMAPYAYNAIKKGGYFVTSGIIDFKEEPVKSALTEAGFEIIDTLYMGEWVGVICRK